MADLLTERVKTTQCIAPINSTADINGTSVDRAGYNDLAFVAMVGITGDTLSGSIYLAMELEHSDDNSSFSDCADTDLNAAVTAANTGSFAKIDDNAEDDARYVVNYIGTKRYVRPVANYVGTHTNGMEIAVLALQGEPRSLPVS
jgi:hypothetical protein